MSRKSTPEIKSRTDLADSIAAFLSEQGLSEVYGSDPISQGKFISIPFCKARTIDGEVRLYSAKFVYVGFQTAYRNLPRRDNLVFTSVEDAFEFIRLAFVEHDDEAAYRVPTK